MHTAHLYSLAHNISDAYFLVIIGVVKRIHVQIFQCQKSTSFQIMGSTYTKAVTVVFQYTFKLALVYVN